MAKLTIIVQASNVNLGEITNVVIDVEPMDAAAILKETMTAYYHEVVDEDDLLCSDFESQWEDDDCQIVGMFHGEPIGVTGNGLNVAVMATFLAQKMEFIASQESLIGVKGDEN